MPFVREQIKERLAALASQNVFIGTSSWKYPGWCGTLYTPSRYEWHGQFAKSRFEKNCLSEYAEVFKTVCVDSAYYAFPERRFLETMASQVPADFRFAFKVTDEITLKRFPNLPRFGPKAGQLNSGFLNSDEFVSGFLEPCESIRNHVGLLIFEFSRFHPSDYEHGRDFVAELDVFLSQLPKGWPYGVEIRNKQWLHPEFFACLARHEVTFVYNSWEAMPPVSDQMALAGSVTTPELVAARFLLKAGRKYADAVEKFAPYDKTKEINADARQSGRALIGLGLQKRGGKIYLYVNNRLEGNALETISAMVE